MAMTHEDLLAERTRKLLQFNRMRQQAISDFILTCTSLVSDLRRAVQWQESGAYMSELASLIETQIRDEFKKMFGHDMIAAVEEWPNEPMELQPFPMREHIDRLNAEFQTGVAAMSIPPEMLDAIKPTNYYPAR